MASDPRTEELEEEATKQHYAAVGYVAATWAYFEAVIDDWALRIAKIPVWVGVCLTSQIPGHARKLDAFMALCQLRGADAKNVKHLHKLVDKANGLAEQRNRVVHDVWDLADPAQPHRREATARKKLRLLALHVPTEDVLKLAENIIDCRAEFEELALIINLSLATSLKSTPPAPHM